MSQATLVGRRIECETLDRLLATARAGQSAALVLRGETGVGKTALLEYAVERASGCRVVRAGGIESEMELPFAGLHQLCAPLLDRLDQLPDPQRDALATAFGLSAGAPPESFLVGLAVLGLIAAAAEDQVLVCVIDDVHWLDRASAQTIAFVARRLLAEAVAMVFTVLEPSNERELNGLPELVVLGLGDRDARAVLTSAIPRPVDREVLGRILVEARGNPLALLELPRALTPAELGGGFGTLDRTPPPGRMERRYAQELESLPDEIRRVLLTAAAEPVGDPALLLRALKRLGIGNDTAAAAEATGLIELGTPIRFRHTLVRSAVYRSAPLSERQQVHRALADVTDPERDPDRRAWHLALAAPGPSEDVARELERSANRAQARGGLAAAGVFLDRAATLTPEPSQRAERQLSAACVQREAGALNEALALLDDVEAGPPDAMRSAQVDRLRGQIAFDLLRVDEAVRLLGRAARGLEPLDIALARETHLEAISAAIWASGPDTTQTVHEVAEAARAAPPAPEPRRPVDLVLDALALRYTEGYVAAVPALTRALQVVRSPDVDVEDVGRVLWLGGNRAAGLIAFEIWDVESIRPLAEAQVALARKQGALVQLQFALNFLGSSYLLAGDLTAAKRVIEEDELIAEATGNRPIAYLAMSLAAMRGQEQHAIELIDAATDELSARGDSRLLDRLNYYRAVLWNGLGRYDAAIAALRPGLVHDSSTLRPYVVSEIAEAASRTGDRALALAALDWQTEWTRATPTDWALGIEARVRALQSDDDVAEPLYRRSIEYLSRTPLRPELARAHLLLGEWLRRAGRRVDARAELRVAYDMLATMGLDGFAERARNELLATGERVRKRSVDTQSNFTAQEAQIARLAAHGETNQEIGARLFISPRTVEWHLRNVFIKLGITSRRELSAALPASLVSESTGP